MTTKKPIGAFATIRYIDEKEPIEGVYFSFGEYDEDSNEDSYGINDLFIFFYCEGEEDLKSFMKKGAEDFVVMSYELEYEMAELS
jgi:hypothetical protein